MGKSFEEWKDDFAKMAKLNGYCGPFDSDVLYEQYENGVDAFWAGRNFVTEMKETVCPECLNKCSSAELEMFGGFCEDCAGDD